MSESKVKRWFDLKERNGRFRWYLREAGEAVFMSAGAFATEKAARDSINAVRKSSAALANARTEKTE